MKKKNKLLNALMIVMIILIAVSATIAAGSIRGWFGENEESALAKEVVGLAAIERSGIAYSISSETHLKDGDILTTRSGSTLTIEAGKNTLTLGEKTEIKISNAAEEVFTIEVKSGETFARIEEGESIELSFGGNQITTQSAVFSLNVQMGSSGVNIYSGEVEAVKNSESAKAKAGEAISCVGEAVTTSKLSASSLNEFNMENIKKINDNADLCFTDQQIDEVAHARAEELKKAEEERALHETEVLSKGGTQTAASSPKSSVKGTTGEGSTKTDNINDKNNNEQSGSGNKGKNDQNTFNCTISIRCDTILNNMGDLKPGKNKYVPANGVILAASRVEFIEGETVFDVLKRTCSKAGIQLEYSYTPMYGSYYIEGINHLYEFDCGNDSGWMYKVNGWFPNYGCSEYELKDGDTVVWAYTCKGLGADVGGPIY